MDDHELHAHLIGHQGSRAALNTPVLVLDRNQLDANIAAMQALVVEHGVALRPHAKTHKSVDIALRQIAAGAVGVCCAKIGEAEVLTDGDVKAILITSPVAAPAAIARLAALAARGTDLMATIDHPDVARQIQLALESADAVLDVIIDIDPGIRRTGVASPDAAVALAKVIDGCDRMKLRGVQYYCGMQQHIESYDARRSAMIERTDYLRRVIDALVSAGYPPEIVTGSGTGTHRIDLELGVFTELQAGSYVFMDKQYLDCDLTGDGGRPFEPSLAVDARVVSTNHDALVTIDAGFKSLSTDGGVAQVQRGAASDTMFAFMGDEHAALIAPGIGRTLRPGDPVTLTVPHCDPTVNLYDNFHVVQDATLIAIWAVSARGRAR